MLPYRLHLIGYFCQLFVCGCDDRARVFFSFSTNISKNKVVFTHISIIIIIVIVMLHKHIQHFGCFIIAKAIPLQLSRQYTNTWVYERRRFFFADQHHFFAALLLLLQLIRRQFHWHLIINVTRREITKKCLSIVWCKTTDEIWPKYTIKLPKNMKQAPECVDV